MPHDLAAPFAVQRGLAVYRIGEGDPVLLMPGPHRYQQPGDGSSGALIRGLTGTGRSVISFDPPGAGASTREPHLGMNEAHECSVEALAASGVTGPVDVFGHSMAGLVALAFALHHPALVKRLVLVGTGSGGPAYMRSAGALWNRTHPDFRKLAALGFLHILWPSRGSELAMLNFIERASFHDPTLAAAEEVGWRDWLRPRRGRSDWHRIAKKLDYGAELHRVAVPTLVLCGRHDPQFPPTASLELADEIPGAELVWFERSGHYPFLEEPGPFWAAVQSFLSAPCPPTQ